MKAFAVASQDVLERTSSFEPPRHRRSAVLSFAPGFRLDLAEERLWKGEIELRLRSKPFAILRYLVQHPRRLVTHSEIVEAVWGRGIAMCESLLRTHVRDLRRALGEALIETVFGRGYRFNANPRESDEAGSVALRLVQSTEAAAAPTPSTAQARVLQELASGLAALGANAAVLLILGDGVSRSVDSSVSVQEGPYETGPKYGPFTVDAILEDVQRFCLQSSRSGH